MREFVLAVVLTLGLLTEISFGQLGEPHLLPLGQGIILPIQDRTGTPETVEFLELLVRQEISQMGSLSEIENLRDTLRRLRIREVTTSAPAKLDQLAHALDVDWFVSTTLHELVEEPVPQVTLSAQIFRPASGILDWSGFVSLTGLDRQTWLGLGRVDSLQDLLRTATIRLFQDLRSGSPGDPKNRLKVSTRGFLLQPVPPDPTAMMAVIPFNSITDRNPMAIAELQTRACLAALAGAGFTVVLPGAIREVLRKNGRLLLGEVDHATAKQLQSQLGAEWVLTGAVETYRAGTGLQPDPWVAVGARIVSADTGQIYWIDGSERRGSDSDVLFEQGRIYSAANLSFEMTRSLIAGFTGRRRRN